MRSLDRLEQQKQMTMKKKQRPPEEETEEELPHPQFIPLNRTKSAFDDSAQKKHGGINTTPSVFQRQSLFSTEDERPS